MAKIGSEAPHALRTGDVIVVGEQIQVNKSGQLSVRHRDGSLEQISGPTTWIKLKYRTTRQEQEEYAEIKKLTVASVKPRGLNLLYPAKSSGSVPILGFHLRTFANQDFRAPLKVWSANNVIFERPDAHFVNGIYVDPVLNSTLTKFAGQKITIELGAIPHPVECTLLSAADETDLRSTLSTFSVLEGQDRLTAEVVVLNRICGAMVASEQARMSKPWESLDPKSAN
jgi:hypothetical protein